MADLTIDDIIAGKLPPEVEQKMAAEALRGKQAFQDASEKANQYQDLAVIAQMSNNPALANAANMLDKNARAQYGPEKLGTQGFVVPGTGEFIPSPMYHDERKAAQIANLVKAKEAQTAATLREREITEASNQRAAQTDATNQLRLSLEAARANQADATKRELAQLKTDKDTAKQDLQFNKNVTNFSNTLDKAKVPDLEDSISTIEGVLKNYKAGSLPGVGRYEGRIPEALLNNEQQLVRQAIQQPLNIMTNMRSGLAVSDQEMRRILMEMGTGPGMDEATLRNGIKRLREIFDAKKNNLIAGATPEVLAEYNTRAGTNFAHKGGAGAPTPTPSGMPDFSGLPPAQRARAEELWKKANP